MGGLVESLLGSGESRSVTEVNAAPPTAEETELIKLNTQLAQRQLQNLDQLQPFQQKLLELSMSDLDSQLASSRAINAAVSPQDQAALAKQNFELERRLGPIQEELLQRQLEQIRTGGAATPEQLQRIKEAADAGIAAGTGDIDRSTQKGIGLIADELANSRGLRLSDSPIMAEAGQLVQGGEELKASLIKNLRAGEATARLNYPLAAGQLTSGINMGQQNLSQATAQFQAELRQRAFQNRLALSGQNVTGGIGIASVGNGVGASTLGALTSVRGRNSRSSGFDPAALLKGHAAFGEMLQGWMPANMGSSDRRLKHDIKRIGTLENGIPVYRFKFIGEPGEHIGVMADEVLKVMPEAVSTDERGFFLVDYAKLH